MIKSVCRDYLMREESLRQFITNYWLTILMSLITIGVLIWTGSGILNLLKSVDKINTPNQFDIPTQLPPTANPLPATPQGNFSLKNDLGKSILISDEGVPTYELDTNRQWIPIVPDNISENLPEISEFVMKDGVWIIADEGGNPIYRWNSAFQRWMEARISSSSSSENALPSNQFIVVSDQFEVNELLLKTDEELLAIAPHLSPEVYGIDVDILTPSSVLRIGKNENIPYLLYTDQSGQVKMGWNIENSEVEHVSESMYRDPQTRFLVRALVITDNLTVRNKKRWYSLHEINRGDLAKALFEYTLPINYFYRNYSDAFREMLGGWNPVSSSQQNEELSVIQVNKLLSESRTVFEEDIKEVADDERLIIRVGESNAIQVNREAFFLLRITLGSSYRTRGGGSSHNITIVPEARFESDLFTAVGGLLVKTLREITIGGRQSIYQGHLRGERSTTEQMVIDLCGEEAINDYLERLGGEIGENGIIPVYDTDNSNLPLCLLIEH